MHISFLEPLLVTPEWLGRKCPVIFAGVRLLLGTRDRWRADLYFSSMFGRLRIPRGLVQRAGVVRVSDFEAREVYGINGSGSCGSGISIWRLSNAFLY